MSEVINKVATDATLTTQEQNWEIFSVLGMRWSEVTELTTEDRTFLLDKVESVKEQMRAQQFAASQM
jgi:hypothetical protein|tara:strand:+ start:5097 stop:5297 length:201 start_codon:yes stop_codon:yes gene_type:complete